MLDSQCRKNNPREEVAWCADNVSVILQKINVKVICRLHHFQMGCIVVTGFVLTNASRRPSAIAELLVYTGGLYQVLPKE